MMIGEVIKDSYYDKKEAELDAIKVRNYVRNYISKWLASYLRSEGDSRGIIFSKTNAPDFTKKYEALKQDKDIIKAFKNSLASSIDYDLDPEIFEIKNRLEDFILNDKNLNLYVNNELKKAVYRFTSKDSLPEEVKALYNTLDYNHYAKELINRTINELFIGGQRSWPAIDTYTSSLEAKGKVYEIMKYVAYRCQLRTLDFSDQIIRLKLKEMRKAGNRVQSLDKLAQIKMAKVQTGTKKIESIKDAIQELYKQDLQAASGLIKTIADHPQARILRSRGVNDLEIIARLGYDSPKDYLLLRLASDSVPTEIIAKRLFIVENNKVSPSLTLTMLGKAKARLNKILKG